MIKDALVYDEIRHDDSDHPILAVPEYRESVIEYQNEENLKRDENYFKDVGKRSVHPSKSKIKFKSIEKKISILENQSYFGDLLLPSNIQVSFKAKTSTIPLKLLNYSSGVECNDSKTFLYYDIDYSPKISEGTSFFSFLGEAYLRELEKIIDRGFVKEYVKKEENLDYLKGKLNVKEQINKNFAEPKFHCRYFDLTIDNLCNQMVVYAGYKLGKLLSTESSKGQVEKIRSDILGHIENLKNIITLRSMIFPEEANNVFITRKNECYEKILDISKMVINEVYYQSEGSTSPLGYNYLVDMNVIFERTVFKVFRNVLRNYSQKENGEITIEDQKVYRSIGKMIDLPKKRSLKILPDITVLDENSPIAVIETKYKSDVSNIDYYQLLIYSLYLKRITNDFNAAILVHFSEKREDEIDRLTLHKGNINLSEFAEIADSKEKLEDIGLYRITINIQESEDEDFQVDSLETELDNKLRKGEGAWDDLKKSISLKDGLK